MVLDQGVAADTMGIDGQFKGDSIAQPLVETGSLEAEGLQVEVAATMGSCVSLESANKGGTQALGPMLGRNPQLLQLAAAIPTAAHGAADDTTIPIVGEARQGADLVQGSRSVIGQAKAVIDSPAFCLGDRVMSDEGEEVRGHGA